MVVLVHTAIVALWAGPSNPIKDAVGPQRVREYVNPVFEQNWNIFAPTPKRVMTDLDFRLRVKDRERDRKSTRLNSSHVAISYAVFCLKKKKRERAVRR